MVTAICAEFRLTRFSFPPVNIGPLLIEPGSLALEPVNFVRIKSRAPRVRICNRCCERFENEPGGPDLFQVSGVVLRRGCRRCESQDSFRIPTPHSAIRAAKI